MKLEFPVAKIRKEDGIPAVWITFTNWMVLEVGIVRYYLDQRSSWGGVLARREAKMPWVTDCMAFELTHAEAALLLYRVGWGAHQMDRSDPAAVHFTPESLVAAGDRCQKRAYDEQLAKFPPAAQANSHDGVIRESAEEAGYSRRGPA